MGDEAALSRSIQEEEFWKRYRTLRTMLAKLKERSALARQIRDEPVIPDQARDFALRALTAELSGNLHQFYDGLLNFISIGQHGFHKIDIECSFSIREEGVEFGTTHLIVDGESEEIPVEIGRRCIDHVLRNAGQKPLETIVQFYKKEETRFDAMLGGSLERCSLHILDEKYPEKQVHVRIRLPAQVLQEHRIGL